MAAYSEYIERYMDNYHGLRTGNKPPASFIINVGIVYRA